MSYFDDASLVFIPSGTKTSKAYSVKPIDGSGDLTFTRSNDTATRVNSAGLIEKVRTNVVLRSEEQSNAQYTTVINEIASRVAVANPLTGQNNAYKITSTANNDPYIGQVVTGLSNGENTFSLWLWTDAGQSTEATLFFYNQTTSEVYTKAITLTTTPTRFDHTVNFSNIGSNATVRLDLRQTGPTVQYVYTYGWQAESGVATPYIATTTAAVSVGPVANVPRLDYLNSSCPRLLLEPQRTNVALYSEQFNGSSWTKSGSGVGIAPVVTANNGISPDGYQNADRIDLNLNGGTSLSDWSWVYQSFSATGTQPQAFSIYLKAATAGDVGKVIRVGFISYVTHTLTADWTRVVLNQTFGTTSTFYIGFRLRGAEATANTASLYAWGAQLEQNAAYSSSYIPTLASASTRGADAASKTGITSLIGQTEGTLFAEVDLQNFDTSADQLIAQLFQDSNNRLGLAMYRSGSTNRLQFYQLFGGNIEVNINTLASAGVFKLAGAYKNNDYVFYVNGVQIGVDTTASVPTASSITLGTGNSGVAPLGNAVKELILFKTRLSNADLAALTA